MKELSGFRELGLSERTIKALWKKGFSEPTEIQKLCIPLLLKENTEVIGQAQTGTGKTAAFALPIIETLGGNSPDVEALVLCPTRELAMQVANEIESLKGEKNIRIAAIYGGASMPLQIKKLKSGLDVVVGTQQAEGERQVVGGAFLAHVGGGEVDDGVAQGQPEACVAQGGLHAGATFAHSAVGEADHEEVFSDGCAYFDLNGSGFEAVDGGTEYADQAVGCFGHGGRVFFYRARRSPSAL